MVAGPRTRRLLMIGLDSATPAWLESGMAEGWLPNLARLRERGTYGRLRSTAEWLVSSHWASFSMGVPPEEHGCYHFIQWDPVAMALRRPDPGWMVREPFWRELASRGAQVVALDVPYTHAPKANDAVELSGWATNELIFKPYAQPRWVRELARETYGGLPRATGQGLAFEKFTPLPLPELLRIGKQLEDIAEKSSRFACEMMEREPWGLFVTILGSVHRAGHQLWSGSSAQAKGGPAVDRALRTALRDVYVSCDRAIGRLVAAAGEDTPVLVFGLIGMGPNTSRTDVLPTMLARILSDDPHAAADHERLRLAKRLRKAVPLSLRHAIKASLPLSIQDRLGTFWRVGRTDWSRTRAFSLTADVHGYIRINLRGRESRGIVEPGEQYDRLCSEISAGLTDFVDLKTGEPVVAEVKRVDALFPPTARRDALPDLIVRWAPSPCADTAGLASSRFGAIPWPTPGRNPNGRSGNHTAEGFVLAAGGGIPCGSSVGHRAHILDLPPTVLAILGEQAPSYMTGRVLDAIVPTSSPTSGRE